MSDGESGDEEILSQVRAATRKRFKIMDPRMTDEERQETRVKIRAHQDEAMERRDEIIAGETDAFREMVNKQNSLLDQIVYQSEAIEDSKFLKLLSQYSEMQLKSVAKSRLFTTDEMVTKVVMKFGVMGDDEDEDCGNVQVDWVKLGKECSKNFNMAHCPSFLSSTWGVQVQPVVRQKHAKVDKTVEAVVVPELIKEPEKETKSQTDSRVQEMLISVNKQKVPNKDEGEMSWVKLVLNPKSFADTIENIFDSSFLVKKANVIMKADPNVMGKYKVEFRKGDSIAAETMPSSQAVLCFSYDDFIAMKEAFEIKESFLPTRNTAALSGSSSSSSSSSSSNGPKRKRK